MEMLLTAAQRGEPGSHAVLRVMYIFLYIHTCVTYVFLMFLHLWSVPGGWLWLSPQRPLLLIHPKCKSLHLPTASSWASLSSPLPLCNLESDLCGFQAGFDAQTQTCHRELALEKSHAAGAESWSEVSVTPVPTELGEGEWGGLGCWCIHKVDSREQGSPESGRWVDTLLDGLLESVK